MQKGTIDAVQSDDDSMASPTEVTVFGGYFPFGSRYSLDVPVLFNQYGLGEIWDKEYSAGGREAHVRRCLGPLPFRHQGPDPITGRSEGQTGLHIPNGRSLS